MRRPVIIVGGGGHARVLIDALLAGGSLIAGITDPDPELAGRQILGVPVLGDDHEINRFPPAKFRLVNGIGSVGLPMKRAELFTRFKGMGYDFATIVHPAAVIATDVMLGEGTQVMAGVIVQTGCRIGANVIINTRASVDHDCIIGNHVHISPGTTLSGNVEIGALCHMGTGSTAIQGVTIGEKSLVAAGAVIIGDVRAGAKMLGIPAREFA